MFYYSETKYLHEVRDGVITGGIKGFAKITFREERGTVSLHIDAKEAMQPDGVELILYEASENEALHRIIKKKGEIKRENIQFTVNLQQTPFAGEECWFGCLIHAGDRWYGEEGEYLKKMFAESTKDNKEENTGKKKAAEEKIAERGTTDEAASGHGSLGEKQGKQKVQKETEETGKAEKAETTEKTGKAEKAETAEETGKAERAETAEETEEAETAGEAGKTKEAEIEMPAQKEAAGGEMINGAGAGERERMADGGEKTFWKAAYLNDLTKLGEANREWERYGQNSFLLHGFYNYKHLIATKELLGVPGNYYDKEKQVAAMFGFHGFLPVKELEQFLSGGTVYTDRQITPGTFGYYFEEEKNLDSFNTPQGDRRKVRYADRRKGF